jgi:hypothetical protein
VDIRISYLTRTGTGNVVFTDTVKANSRKTYDMADKLSETTAATVVQVLFVPGAKNQQLFQSGVIVEHSIYYGGRWSGSSSIGAYAPLVI